MFILYTYNHIESCVCRSMMHVEPLLLPTTHRLAQINTFKYLFAKKNDAFDAEAIPR